MVNDCYAACLFFRMGGHFTRLGLAAKRAVKKKFKGRLDRQGNKGGWGGEGMSYVF